MIKHLHYFETEAEYNQERQTNYVKHWLSCTETASGRVINYNKTSEEEARDALLGEPLTFEVLSAGVIRWKANSVVKTIQYNKNDTGWIGITSATGNTAPSISVIPGDIVKFKGDNVKYGEGNGSFSTFSGTTCQFKAYGNTMSLINSSNFSTLRELASGHNFDGLFYGCTGLTDVGDLFLPATTLAIYCYSAMFQGCSSLSVLPSLPATTLAEGCYASMFRECTSITSLPENYLPAETCVYRCYSTMFRGCTGLTHVYGLPAKTLANSSYEYMFYGCTSITYIKCLAEEGIGSYTYRWLMYISSTPGTFVKSPNVSVSAWPRNENGIPSSWTIEGVE